MWRLLLSPLSWLRSFLYLLRDILKLSVLLLRLCLSILSLVRAITYFLSRRQFWVWSFITFLFSLSLPADAQSSPSPSPSPTFHSAATIVPLTPYPSPTFHSAATIVPLTPQATVTPAFQFSPEDCAGAEFMTSQQFASLSFLWRTRCRRCVERWYEHNNTSPVPTSEYSVLIPTSLIPTSLIPTSVIPTSVIPSPSFGTPTALPSGTPTALPSATPAATSTLLPTSTSDASSGCSSLPLPTPTPVAFDQVIFHRVLPYPHDWGDAVYNSWSPYDLSGVYLNSFFTISYYSPDSSYAYYSSQSRVWHLVGIYVPLDRLVYRARVTGQFTFNRHLMANGSRQFALAMLGGQVVGGPYEVRFNGYRDPVLLDITYSASATGSPADGFVFGFYVYPSSNWGVLAHLSNFTVLAQSWSFPSPTPTPCVTPTPVPVLLDPYCLSPDFSSSELLLAEDFSFEVQSSYCYQVTPRIPEIGLRGGWLCVDWVRFPRISILGFTVDTSLSFAVLLVGFILVSIFRR